MVWLQRKDEASYEIYKKKRNLTKSILYKGEHR